MLHQSCRDSKVDVHKTWIFLNPPMCAHWRSGGALISTFLLAEVSHPHRSDKTTINDCWLTVSMVITPGTPSVLLPLLASWLYPWTRAKHRIGGLFVDKQYGIKQQFLNGDQWQWRRIEIPNVAGHPNIFWTPPSPLPLNSTFQSLAICENVVFHQCFPPSLCRYSTWHYSQDCHIDHHHLLPDVVHEVFDIVFRRYDMSVSTWISITLWF